VARAREEVLATRRQRRGTPNGTSLNLDGTNSSAAELGLAGGRQLAQERRPPSSTAAGPFAQPCLELALERAFPVSSIPWGTQIHASCCSGVFMDESAEAGRVGRIWSGIRADEAGDPRVPAGLRPDSTAANLAPTCRRARGRDYVPHGHRLSLERGLTDVGELSIQVSHRSGERAGRMTPQSVLTGKLRHSRAPDFSWAALLLLGGPLLPLRAAVAQAGQVGVPFKLRPRGRWL